MTIDRICVDCGSTLVAMLYQLVFVLLLTRSYSSAEQKHQLLFSYITTVTGGIRAIGGRPVVDLALEEINSRNDILQNYTLNYTTIRNSEVYGIFLQYYVFGQFSGVFFFSLVYQSWSIELILWRFSIHLWTWSNHIYSFGLLWLCISHYSCSWD